MTPDKEEGLERVERAIDDIRNGRMVILVDDEDRENEGDLVFAAEMASAENINFMAKYGRGLICLSLTPERCDQLELPLMVQDNTSGFGTAFTVSIEAATGVTTGISAADRARTVRVAVAPNARPADLSRPGHVFPLRARAGGVLVRTGQTEGSVDLARLAGLEPAGVICEIMNEDGTMSRRPQLEEFAQEHNLIIISVAELIRYRLLKETMVRAVASVELELGGIGQFKVITYRTTVDDLEHLAIVKGQPVPDKPTLGRVQQESVISDVFQGADSRSRRNFEYALKQMEADGCGVFVYLQKPAPRLENEVRSLAGQAPLRPAIERGDVGLPKDLREYGIGAQILVDCGVRKLRLISNSPGRLRGSEGYGLEVVESIPIPTS